MRKAGNKMALRCSSVRWQSRSDISNQEAGVGRLMTCLYWKSDARPRSPPLPNEGTGDPARRQRRGHLFPTSSLPNLLDSGWFPAQLLSLNAPGISCGKDRGSANVSFALKLGASTTHSFENSLLRKLTPSKTHSFENPLRVPSCLPTQPLRIRCEEASEKAETYSKPML